MELSDIVVVMTHILVFVVFANRYFIGMYVKRIRGDKFDETIEGYEPTVGIVVPMFNEGHSIYRTICSLAELDYPADKLQVVVVDDCSTDNSYEWAMKAAARFPNVRVLRNKVNMGKRRGIVHAVRETETEIIVSVDSDVIVDKDVIKVLMARFVRPEIAAVGGRVNILNANDNWLTKMQTIKYFFGYEYLKNLENSFNTVMCLSGCLTAYRRHVLLELEPVLEDRNLFGIAIKYGEDRFLTRQIVKAGYETTMTLKANSYTIAPPKVSQYFSQQLRWRRSNLVDYLGGLSHIWKVHPAVTVHYLGLFAMIMSYPMIIWHHLILGNFFELAVIHVGILAVFSSAYQLHTAKIPKEYRVHPVYFLMMAVVMPVTYMLLTPLALFTLDTGSWETRGHADEPAPDIGPVAPQPAPVAVASAPQPAMAHGNVLAMAGARASRVQNTGPVLPVLQEQHASGLQRAIAADGGR